MTTTTATAGKVFAMFRSLPRFVALAGMVLSCSAVTVAEADAQEQMILAVAPQVAQTRSVLTSATLFPLAPVANTTEAGPAVVSSFAPDFSGIRRPALLPALYASNIVLQALDAHSTLTALEEGATEANPMMKGVAGNKGALLAVKAGAAGATIFLAEKLWRRNRVAALVLMTAVNGATAAIVAHNYKVASRLR